MQARSSTSSGRGPAPRALPALLLLALIVTLAGCAPRTEIRSAEPIGPIHPPRFELVPGQTSIERFDPPGAGGGLSMTVATLAHNDNPFPVRLASVDYTVLLQGKPVTKGRLEPDLFLDAGATAPLRFAIETNLKGNTELLRAVVRAFADTPLAFRIEGRMRFTSLSYAFDTQTRVLVDGSTLARQSVAPPRLRLDEGESRVYLLRPGVPVVQAVLQAANPGDIGYFLYGKDLVLTLAGHEMAREDMRPVPLAAGRDGRIDILFYPVPSELPGDAAAALDAALSGIPTLLRVDGSLYMDVLGIDSFEVPGGWGVTGFVDADR